MTDDGRSTGARTITVSHRTRGQDESMPRRSAWFLPPPRPFRPTAGVLWVPAQALRREETGRDPAAGRPFLNRPQLPPRSCQVTPLPIVVADAEGHSLCLTTGAAGPRPGRPEPLAGASPQRGRSRSRVTVRSPVDASAARAPVAPTPQWGCSPNKEAPVLGPTKRLPRPKRNRINGGARVADPALGRAARP